MLQQQSEANTHTKGQQLDTAQTIQCQQRNLEDTEHVQQTALELLT